MADFDDWDRLVDEANRALQGDTNNITTSDITNAIEQLQSVVDGSSYTLMQMSMLAAQRIAALERENAALRQEIQKLKNAHKIPHFD
ncbi:Putative basic leucine zipper (bZIP) protein [Pacmanvirus A23]|uniref:Putative basic leucine zipper (bZIP) protein n=1 Tax=Pacmanvirus A23 TaxID=1932881 RepID=UPI000A0932B4|nr:Putative basic leucine zipper (bZIP) protein [Pacmanvirus A23]SIP85846.1 Putative basic leucine zipper (bZIP) protein [Pacmanvirus A23]